MWFGAFNGLGFVCWEEEKCQTKMLDKGYESYGRQTVTHVMHLQRRLIFNQNFYIKYKTYLHMDHVIFTVEILSKISKALCVSNDYILGGRENGKVPEKVVDILECFTPEQMEHVQDILKLIQEMSARQAV